MACIVSSVLAIAGKLIFHCENSLIPIQRGGGMEGSARLDLQLRGRVSALNPLLATQSVAACGCGLQEDVAVCGQGAGEERTFSSADCLCSELRRLHAQRRHDVRRSCGHHAGVFTQG
eukprot:760670-Hanusia_phi.AAC.4